MACHELFKVCFLVLPYTLFGFNFANGFVLDDPMEMQQAYPRASLKSCLLMI